MVFSNTFKKQGSYGSPRKRPHKREHAWVDVSDDDLEVLARLGEGAGGAVHKVRDRRDGRIMARKTITTREAEPIQILRELRFMSDTNHPNICQFFGAYISPSSSEVKVVMELCEGGSLDAVGRQIKTLNRTISEKTAARLAEGVCLCLILYFII